MTETIQPRPLPNLRSRTSKSTRTTASNPKYSPSAESTTSLSSLPSTESESIEDQEKKYDDPYPDFLWMTTEEPHRSRRMAILKAHPEVCLLRTMKGEGDDVLSAQ
jgi:sphingolipid delta-4 desaturase